MVQSVETPVVPQEYGGKWIAWNFQRTRILASGRTFAEPKRGASLVGRVRMN